MADLAPAAGLQPPGFLAPILIIILAINLIETHVGKPYRSCQYVIFLKVVIVERTVLFHLFSPFLGILSV